MADATFSKTFLRRATGAEGMDPTEATNGLRHVMALSLTKVADGLIDPKLILSWLMTALGAPGYLIGALVPLREAGALLPQIVLAPRVQAMRHRKWMWVAGSAGQGACAALIVLSALALDGRAAGLAICSALAVLALFRAACSVSFKDILGKTIAKRRRGAITGLAGSVSAMAVIGLALLLMSGLFQNRALVVGAIALAAVFWGLAALVMSRLNETPSETEKGARASIRTVLRDNPQLWRFICTRGLLVSTALAPPYIVMLGGDALNALGALLLASAVASLVSSYIWGRLADRSSRLVLIRSGLVGGVALLAAVGTGLAGVQTVPGVLPAILLVLMVAYHGVRQGRSTYLVDMAPEDLRASYTAVSNTVIGGALLAVGALGGLGSVAGPGWVLAGFATMAFAAAWVGRGLNEVEQG
jgi:MFS family permease